MLLLYLRWHYIGALKELILAWKNFLWFGLRFFSVPLLLRTYFSYWKQFHRPYRSRGFDPQELLRVFGENLFSRVIGAFVRTFFLAGALLFELFVVGAGAVIIALWIIFPFLIAAGLLYPFL